MSVEKLQRALAFAKSMILSGEAMTPTAQKVFDDAMASDNITITHLGTGATKPHGAEGLEWFANPIGLNVVDLVCPEFTCLCPKTGQPDFATIRIRYIPRERCVESKSLKLYIWHFRDRGVFHEAVTKEILDALVKVLDPWWVQVMGEFGVRGGIHEKVLCERVLGADVVGAGALPLGAIGDLIYRYSFSL